MATRTLPSSSRARPFELPLLAIRASRNELLADVQDALYDGEPRRCREQVDRPRKEAPRCEHEARGDHDDALRARAEAHVTAQPEGFGLRPHVRDEEGACDADDREHDRGV